MKKIKILTIILIIIIMLIIGLLVFRFIHNEKSIDSNITYYLVSRELVTKKDKEPLDMIRLELEYDGEYMTICSIIPDECTILRYTKKGKILEIDEWGETSLSGTIKIVKQTKDSLVLEKTLDDNTKIVNYFKVLEEKTG